MESKHEYISVKEYAKRVGLTRQAVYQKLDKSLKNFVKVIDGKKMIDTAIFEEKCQAVNQETVKDSKANLTKCQADSVDLREIIADKEREIERLHSIIEAEKEEKKQLQADMQRTIDSLIARLTDLATQSNVLAANAQNKLPDPEEHNPRAVDSVTVEAAATEIPADTVPVARDPEPKQQPQPQTNKPKSTILPKQKKQKKGFLQKLKGIL